MSVHATTMRPTRNVYTYMYVKKDENNQKKNWMFHWEIYYAFIQHPHTQRRQKSAKTYVFRHHIFDSNR